MEALRLHILSSSLLFITASVTKADCCSSFTVGMATLPSHQTAAVKDAAVARKRRRASTGRVVDNCFTCTKRNVKCDRQRPYCSQCLRIGSVCSGYKTQLTWDVGVASRGKLRGLSLPIANAPPVTRETNESPVWPGPSPSTVSQHRQRRQKQPWSTHNETRGTPRRPLDIPHASYSERTPTMSYLIHGYDYLSMLHPETAHIPQNSWNGRGSVQNLPVVVHSPDATAKHPRSPFYPVTDEAQPSAIHFAGSSMGNDVSYNSLMSQSYPCNGTACVSMLSIMYDGYHNTHSGCPMAYNPLFPLVFDHGCSLTPYSGLVDAPLERNSSPSFHIDPFESHRGRKLVQECDNLSEHHKASSSAYPSY